MELDYFFVYGMRVQTPSHDRNVTCDLVIHHISTSNTCSNNAIYIVGAYACTCILAVCYTSCRFAGDLPLDLNICLKQSNAQTPILLLYTSESAGAERLVMDMANKRSINVITLAISGQNKVEEKMLRKYTAKAATEVRFWSKPNQI